MITSIESIPDPAGTTEAALLEVRDLSVSFHLLEGVVPAVAGMNLKLDYGEILGVVGESACGKSVTARAILRIVPSPPGQIDSGTVLFEGRDLMQLSGEKMQEIRGGKNIHDLPGAYDQPQPGLYRGGPDR